MNGNIEVEMKNLKFKSVVLQNYKAFNHFRIDLREMNVLVGPNNCGKSTILGVFRLLAVALKKANRRKPEIINAPDGQVGGYHISIDDIPVSAENVHTDLKDVNTTVTFELSNGTQLVLAFPSDGGCLMYPKNSPAVTSPTTFKRHFPLRVEHIPVLGPLDTDEPILTKATVQQGFNTHRASRHLRNYWHQNPKGFDEFATQLTESWPGMEVFPPELSFADGAVLHMMCTENRMSRELSWAGFGFQVWCQLLTHLTRTKESDLLIVDEPEIYLHADIQRKLLHIMRDVRPAIVLATHSGEIISEAEPNELLLIDKAKKRSRRIQKASQVQVALDVLGSNHNITLTRVARNRRIVFVEGKDPKLIRMFARRMGFGALANGDGITFIPIGGFAGHTRVAAMKFAFERALGEQLSTGLVLDRDYRCDGELDQLRGKLKDTVDFLHIHDRKEIENYLLIPSALGRALSQQCKKTVGDAENIIRELIAKLAIEMNDAAQAQYISKSLEFWQKTGKDHSTVIAETTTQFRDRWNSNIETYVPGKDLMSRINRFSQEEYGVTLSPSRIVLAARENEIGGDMSRLVRVLEEFRKKQ